MAKESAVLQKLFLGYDLGYFGLPKALLARREAERRVRTAYKTLEAEMAQIKPETVRVRLAKDVIRLAEKGDVPAGAGREYGEETDRLLALGRDHAILLDAWQELQDGAESVWYLAARLSDEILAKHLRPAMDRVLLNVRGGSVFASSIPWGDPVALMRSSEEARDYYQLVATATDHYNAIRDAQMRLKMLAGRPSEEAFALFGQLLNLQEVWPTHGSGVDSIRGKAPWPDDPLARMVWLATSNAKPWMPTAAECEAAYQRVVSENPLRLVMR